ncbi:MAG: tRNA (adenosine(37)-N6)-threonylcarbamoyltransferase complex transferase subunit TsaD [Bacilli bacterium]|jgi:N6-L-threonylcarbamoyladenine synthase|nr:tRNA (adenosine(37)-N6)-threonylcarbamoyltransferase complex transferase subunit TsaD [Bacilli bacterium]
MKDKIILAIESSCDETAMAIIKNNQLLANVVSSQIKNHQDKGGVIPELASRLHLENIDKVFKEAIKKAEITINDIDVIAIVDGPGLVGALHVGVMFAKSLAYINNIKILRLHHIAGHIYANEFIDNFEFPLLALVVSGGHTELVLMKEHLKFEVIGRTLDDAIGESYDKVAKVLSLGYPGGPILDKLAKEGHNIYNFPSPKINDNDFNFSYSGLKSAVINKVNQLNMKKESYKIEDIVCSFQDSAVAPLIVKSLKAIDEYNIKHMIIAGGVAANSYLREQLTRKVPKNVKLTLPPLWCCTDNAAMIASLANHYNYDELDNDLSFGVNPNKVLE